MMTALVVDISMMEIEEIGASIMAEVVEIIARREVTITQKSIWPQRTQS